MSAIVVAGIGAVSPAGWDVAALRAALDQQTPLPLRELARPGWDQPLQVRGVPPPAQRLAFASHARLRRSSAIAQYAVAAGLEALGPGTPETAGGSGRLGIVLSVMCGCVNYSRRFYDEVLREPATASPILFPETVFNAPASHLAALLGARAINYTLVGDPGMFLAGLAIATNWLDDDRVDAALVIGAEEADWLSADAAAVFDDHSVLSEGAGAVLLRRESEAGGSVRLATITAAHSFQSGPDRARAAQRMRAELPAAQPDHLLCDSAQSLPHADAAERAAWSGWTGAHLSPKEILGEGLAAASAWQCVAAIDALQQRRHRAASVSVVGTNQQAIGAQFLAPSGT